MEIRNCFYVKGTEITKQKTELEKIAEINGQMNVNCSGSLVYQSTERNVTIRSGQIDPDGFLAAHRTDGSAYVMILDGDGSIGIVDEEGKEICEMRVVSGDEVVFEKPMRLHFYTAGKAGLSYRVVSF